MFAIHWELKLEEEGCKVEQLNAEDVSGGQIKSHRHHPCNWKMKNKRSRVIKLNFAYWIYSSNGEMKAIKVVCF